MGGGLSARRARVLAARTWRSRRRARGDGVLVWSGVASPVFVGARFWVSSRERERERRRRFSSVGRSLHRLCVRNVVFVYEHTDMVTTTSLLRDRPRLRPRSGRPQLAPPSSVQAALFHRVPGIFYCPAQRSSPSAACTVVSLDRGERALVQEVASGNKCCSGCSERSSSKLCYHVGACRPTSPATETKQPWRHWVLLA